MPEPRTTATWGGRARAASVRAAKAVGMIALVVRAATVRERAPLPHGRGSDGPGSLPDQLQRLLGVAGDVGVLVLGRFLERRDRLLGVRPDLAQAVGRRPANVGVLVLE